MIHVSPNKAFYILFVVSALLIFLLINLLTKITPLTIQHALYNCKQAISGFSIWLPHASPPLFVIVLSFIILTGLGLLIYQIFKTKVFLNKILKNEVKIPERIKTISSELGISNKLVLVNAKSVSSFCFGLVFPKICLSLNLAKRLSHNELKAVLIHERYHLINRDPLKVLLSQVAVSMFFFVPILKDFHKHYSCSKEISADQMVSKTSYLKDLKSALIKTINGQTPSLSGVAFFEGEAILEERIKALTTPNFKLGIKLSLLKISISFFVFVFAFFLLDAQVHAMENDDGSHSYFILSSNDEHLLYCEREHDSTDLRIHPADLFSGTK